VGESVSHCVVTNVAQECRMRRKNAKCGTKMQDVAQKCKIWRKNAGCGTKMQDLAQKCKMWQNIKGRRGRILAESCGFLRPARKEGIKLVHTQLDGAHAPEVGLWRWVKRAGDLFLLGTTDDHGAEQVARGTPV